MRTTPWACDDAGASPASPIYQRNGTMTLRPTSLAADQFDSMLGSTKHRRKDDQGRKRHSASAVSSLARTAWAIVIRP